VRYMYFPTPTLCDLSIHLVFEYVALQANPSTSLGSARRKTGRSQYIQVNSDIAFSCTVYLYTGSAFTFRSNQAYTHAPLHVSSYSNAPPHLNSRYTTKR
jgi:hypothetical protein